MADRTLPNVGLKGFWDLGEDLWKDDHDRNLLKLSVLVQGGVLSKVSATPGAPTDGDVHIFDETHATEPNKIAIRDAGAWVYVTPLKGWLVYNRATDYFELFSGTAWSQLQLGSNTSWKDKVRAATTAAVTLATGLEDGDTLDTVTLATGDRILVKNQASASENGIYVVNATGAPTRATDADTGAEMVNATVYVSEGSQADTLWTCSTDAPITLGATGLAFVQTGAGGGGSTWVRTAIVATAGQTSFSATYVVGSVQVFLNGVLLAASDYTATSGTAVVLGVAAAAGDIVDIIAATSGSFSTPTESMVIALSDETTALTTGTAKVTVYMPYNFTLTEVFIGLSAQSTSGVVTADVNKAGSTIFSTNPSIDANEDTNLTGTAAVLSTVALTKGDKLTFDIDAAGTGAKGLKVYLIGHQ